MKRWIAINAELKLERIAWEDISRQNTKRKNPVVCVFTSKTQSSWTPKTININAIHFMCKKKYTVALTLVSPAKAIFAWTICVLKVGWKAALGQVVAANTYFPEPVFLLDEILDSLVPGDESFDKILKVETIEKCKEQNSTSLKNCTCSQYGCWTFYIPVSLPW